MIPIWRRYHIPLMWSIICAGMVALIVGNTGFWHRQKATDFPVPLAITEAGLQQQEESTVSGVPLVRTYTVAEGDNLGSIARKHGVDVDTIWGANPELSSDIIYPGQQLNILAEKGVLHTVKPGQTFWSIARQYGVDWQKICDDNQKTAADVLQPGQKLFIRGVKPRSESNISRGGISWGLCWPVKGSISSGFGYRWGALHTGVDIAADNGDPVCAAASGRITYAGWLGGYGLAVVIDHGRGWETLYGHASKLYVVPGELVQSGYCIAAVGNTGNSTGPHLHFEVRNQGTPLNPIQYLP